MGAELSFSISALTPGAIASYWVSTIRTAVGVITTPMLPPRPKRQ
jgi:hypothetical protein